MHARRSHTRLPMQLPRLMLPGEAGGPDFASGGTALAAGADPPKQHCRDRQAAHSIAGGAPSTSSRKRFGWAGRTQLPERGRGKGRSPHVLHHHQMRGTMLQVLLLCFVDEPLRVCILAPGYQYDKEIRLPPPACSTLTPPAARTSPPPPPSAATTLLGCTAPTAQSQG